VGGSTEPAGPGPAQGAGPGSGRAPTADVAGSGQPLDVLVVEDDDADVALVEEALAAHRLASRLFRARDGVEALAFLRREGDFADAPRPDLVLLDLNMPRMDGREVLARVKDDAGLRTIPVVVFTTSADEQDVAASYGAHANAYVTKPIDLDRFGYVVGKVHEFYGEVIRRPVAPPGDTSS
jgi:CheY-like chemotaxis protein